MCIPSAAVEGGANSAGWGARHLLQGELVRNGALESAKLPYKNPFQALGAILAVSKGTDLDGVGAGLGHYECWGCLLLPVAHQHPLVSCQLVPASTSVAPRAAAWLTAACRTRAPLPWARGCCQRTATRWVSRCGFLFASTAAALAPCYPRR